MNCFENIVDPDTSINLKREEELSCFDNSDYFYDVPVPTSETVLMDKRIDLRLFCALLLVSNHFSINKTKDDHRYLYDNKLQEVMPYIANVLGVTKKTVMTNFTKLILSETGLVKPEKKGKQYYKLYSKDALGKNYVLINNLTLETLVKNHKSIDIKVYCVLKFLLHNDEDRNITQQWIAEKLGYSRNSRNMIAKSLDRLQDSGLISIESKFIVDRTWIDNESSFTTNMYTLNFYKLTS